MPQWPRLEIVVIGDNRFGQLLASQGHHVVFIAAEKLPEQPLPAAQLYLVDLPDDQVGDITLPNDALVGVHSFGGFAVLDSLAELPQPVFIFAYLGDGRCVLSAPDTTTGQVAELFFTEALLQPELVSLAQYPATVATRFFPIICELVGRSATNESVILPPRLDKSSATAIRQWLPDEIHTLFNNMITYLL